MSPRVPEGTRLIRDSSMRLHNGGRTVSGGSPLRVVRLRPDGQRRLRRWLDGGPVAADAADRALAARLLDAGLVHPVPSGHDSDAPYTVDDVTLVVPVKDDADGVRRLLSATSNMPERIIVDDGSTIALAEATIRHGTAKGPASARETGRRMANTEFVAFLDSDTVPSRDWLDTLLPLFTDPEVVAIAPRVRARQRRSRVADYETTRSSLDLGERPARVQPMSHVSYVPSAALVVRRSALNTVDGFDTRLRFGEDVDLVWRLIDRCGTVRYAPESTVWHDPRPTWAAWSRQRYDYGTSAAPLSRRHPGRLAPLRLSIWSAVAWTFAGAGRPLLGLSVAGITAGLLPGKLRRHGISTRESLRLATTGHLNAGRILAEAVRRAWWPLLLPFAVMSKRVRHLLLATLLPCLVEAARTQRHDRILWWFTARVADDLAYSTGLWAGCLRHRTARPLIPQFAEWPGKSR